MDTPHFITLRFIDLCFIVLHRYYGFFVFFFYFYFKKINKLKVSGDPASSKSTGTIFPMALAHFMSVCHIYMLYTFDIYTMPSSSSAAAKKNTQISKGSCKYS